MNQIVTEQEPRAPMLQGPKRQHYLPRWYLEGFVGADDCLAVYDRTTGGVRRQKPINTGVIGHLYTITDEQGRQRFELENALSQIEGTAAEHFPAVLRGEPITPEARVAIAHFVGVLATRTPDFIKSIQHANNKIIEHFAKIIFSNRDLVADRLRGNEEHAGKSDAEIAAMADELVTFAQSDGYEVETDQQWAMTTALPLGETIATTLVDRQWAVWRAPAGASFVCSDSPVALSTTRPRQTSLYGIGFGSPDALVMVPLNTEFALAMYGQGGTQRNARVDKRIVSSLNKDLARNSQRFLIARDNALVEAVAGAVRMKEGIWRPKIGV